MKKKLQIFVSSTFSDLIDERQKAVETILRSGNIPAGMELFSAGDKSQLETIKEWIRESDVYVLILGGRYGSIEPDTQLSYTEIEYNYAKEINKPLFAIVLSEDYIESKRTTGFIDPIERENTHKYESFKDNVLKKICRICKDVNEIQLAIFESLFVIERDHKLTGWIKGDDIPDNSIILNELNILRKERDELSKKVKVYEKEKNDKSNNIGEYSFDEVYNALELKKIEIPDSIVYSDGSKVKSALVLFIESTGLLTKGIVDLNRDDVNEFYLQMLIPILMNFGLIDRKQTKVGYNSYIISPLGNKFLSKYEVIKNKKE